MKSKLPPRNQHCRERVDCSNYNDVKHAFEHNDAHLYYDNKRDIPDEPNTRRNAVQPPVHSKKQPKQRYLKSARTPDKPQVSICWTQALRKPYTPDRVSGARPFQQHLISGLVFSHTAGLALSSKALFWARYRCVPYHRRRAEKATSRPDASIQGGDSWT